MKNEGKKLFAPTGGFPRDWVEKLCVCVRACVCVRVRACVRACV